MYYCLILFSLIIYSCQSVSKFYCVCVWNFWGRIIFLFLLSYRGSQKPRSCRARDLVVVQRIRGCSCRYHLTCPLSLNRKDKMKYINSIHIKKGKTINESQKVYWNQSTILPDVLSRLDTKFRLNKSPVNTLWDMSVSLCRIHGKQYILVY